MDERSLFLAALDQPTAERAAYLAAADVPAAVRERVAALLAAHADAGGFAAAPAPGGGTGAYTSAGDTDPAAAGRQVGPYKLLQPIGEGGMGSVWMAEQEAPVRRRVALKLIKPGMDSDQVIARFEAERQALALMDHVNIAKVLDAGTTPEGRPFFVMELIRGEPITKYCDANHLTARERLELFVPVCQAVQHAHQKGVIHRDLKPSNVLVTLYDGKPVPKVIDFGVAKALHQRLTDRTMFTAFGAVVGTLEYMAPEQAALSHLDVDTRSDVYSLGVLLYELLTGSTPLERKRLREAAFDEVLRMIREEEPPKPSTRLSTSEALPAIAANRRTEPAKLSRLVRGELDWIVMKALEKDRGRRYETANGFARDVQRYLADEPVEACPPSAAYRLRKFMRRHRGPVLAATLVLLALVGGIAGMAWGLVRARAATAFEAEQRRLARAAVDDMMGGVEPSSFLMAQKDLLPSQRAFLERALKHYLVFAAAAPTDAEGRGLVAAAHTWVGCINFKMGRSAEARAAFQSAIDVHEALVRDFPAVSKHRLNLAMCYGNLASLLYAQLGRPTEAERPCRAKVDLLEGLLADQPNDRWRLELAYAQKSLGLVLVDQHRYAEAEVQFAAARQALERLVTDHPDWPPYAGALAETHEGIAKISAARGQTAQSVAACRAAVEILIKLAANPNAATETREVLAISHQTLAQQLFAAGDTTEAEKEYRKCLVVQEKLFHDFPAAPDLRKNLAIAHRNFSAVLVHTNQLPEADASLRYAAKLLGQLVELYPAVPAYQSELALVGYRRAQLLEAQGKWAEAESEWRSAIRTYQKLVDKDPTNHGYRVSLADRMANLGVVLGHLGHREESLATYQTVLPQWERLAAEMPDMRVHRLQVAATHANIGETLHFLKRWNEAEAAYQRALKSQQALAAGQPAAHESNVNLQLNRHNLGELAFDRGDDAAAVGWFSQAITALTPILKADDRVTYVRTILGQSHKFRAAALAHLGRFAEAGTDWDVALALDDGSQRTALRLGRAEALVHAGDAGKALTAADELAAEKALEGCQCYKLAKVYAAVAAKLPPADAARAQARSDELTRRAAATGFPEVNAVLKGNDLDSYRRRVEYADLLWDLADGQVAIGG